MKNIILLLLINYTITAQNCKGIKEEIDKFTGEKTYNTTYLAPIVLIKNIKGVDTTYYVSINMTKSSSNYEASGAYILFQNGDKIIKEGQKVNCKYESGSDKYYYTAFFRIDIDDLSKFTTSPITDFKLYIYEDTIGKGNGNRIMEFAKCLLTK